MGRVEAHQVTNSVSLTITNVEFNTAKGRTRISQLILLFSTRHTRRVYTIGHKDPTRYLIPLRNGPN